MIKAVDAQGKVHIYATIAEAARALDIDSSNIGKVLRGRRPTAGGYTFQRTEERPTTRAGRKTVREKRERTERKQILSRVHDTLKELNVRYRNAVKEGVFTSDPVLSKMMSYSDYFGSTKTGGYNISVANLKQFSTSELQNLMKMLKRDERQYIRIAERDEDIKNAAAIAATFGITINQVNAYEDVLPALFDLLHLAKIDNFFRYSDVQVSLYQAMQSNASPEELQNFIDQIYSAYMGNDTNSLESIINQLDQYGENDEFSDFY